MVSKAIDEGSIPSVLGIKKSFLRFNKNNLPNDSVNEVTKKQLEVKGKADKRSVPSNFNKSQLTIRMSQVQPVQAANLPKPRSAGFNPSPFLRLKYHNRLTRALPAPQGSKYKTSNHLPKPLRLWRSRWFKYNYDLTGLDYFPYQKFSDVPNPYKTQYLPRGKTKALSFLFSKKPITKFKSSSISQMSALFRFSNITQYSATRSLDQSLKVALHFIVNFSMQARLEFTEYLSRSSQSLSLNSCKTTASFWTNLRVQSLWGPAVRPRSVLPGGQPFSRAGSKFLLRLIESCSQSYISNKARKSIVNQETNVPVTGFYKLFLARKRLQLNNSLKWMNIRRRNEEQVHLSFYPHYVKPYSLKKLNYRRLSPNFFDSDRNEIWNMVDFWHHDGSTDTLFRNTTRSSILSLALRSSAVGAVPSSLWLLEKDYSTDTGTALYDEHTHPLDATGPGALDVRSGPANQALHMSEIVRSASVRPVLNSKKAAQTNFTPKLARASGVVGRILETKALRVPKTLRMPKKKSKLFSAPAVKLGAKGRIAKALAASRKSLRRRWASLTKLPKEEVKLRRRLKSFIHRLHSHVSRRLGRNSHPHASRLTRALKAMSALGSASKTRFARRLRSRLGRKLFMWLQLPDLVKHCNFLPNTSRGEPVFRLEDANQTDSGKVNWAFSELQTPSYRDLVSHLVLSTRQSPLTSQPSLSPQTHVSSTTTHLGSTAASPSLNLQKLTVGLTTLLYAWPCLTLLKYVFFSDLSRYSPYNLLTYDSEHFNLFYKVQMWILKTQNQYKALAFTKDPLDYSNSNLWSIPVTNYTIRRKFLRLAAVNLFSINISFWLNKTLIQFIESCSGRKTLLFLGPFLESLLTFEDRAQLFLWQDRVAGFKRLLGHRIFVNEALEVVLIAIRLRDPVFLANWMRGMLQRMSFWKYRLLFRFIKFIFKEVYHESFKSLGFRGVKLQLKGKISVAGNARTRTLLMYVGDTSHTTLDNRVAYDLSYINTFTGVLGFRIWFFY